MITEAGVQDALAEILTAENAGDWAKVEFLSLALVSQGASKVCPNHIYHFIDDFDIRRRDSAYAERQGNKVRTYLSQR